MYGFLNVVWIRLMPTVLLLIELRSHRLPLGLYILKGCVGRKRRQRFAEIGLDAVVVRSGIDASQNALTIGANPYTYVEGRAFGRFLQRIRASGRSGRSPHQFLRRKSLYPGVRENRRQRRRKSKAVG